MELPIPSRTLFLCFRVGMKVTIRKGKAKDAEAIVNTTNVAFMADAFFKRKEYHDRFTREDVVAMMTATDSIFIVAECEDFDDGNASGADDDVDARAVEVRDVLNAVGSTGSPTKAFTPVSLLCGSMYLHWQCEAAMLVGKFSAVSVPAQFSKRGLGSALVAAAEGYLKLLLKEAKHCTCARMEMGIINVRRDLFPWYEKQGYVRIGDMPRDNELQRIVSADHAHVCCVLMRKTLS